MTLRTVEHQALIRQHQQLMLKWLATFEAADAMVDAIKAEATQGLTRRTDIITAKVRVGGTAVMKDAKDERTDARLRVLMHAAVVTALKGQ